MKTEKLFVKDRYLKACTSKIVALNFIEPLLVDLILDKTVFFPTGGGQSCDLGQINDFKVKDVFENEGIVHHIVEFTNDAVIPSIGKFVNCTLDWDRRFLNMQRHCGEHILSGIFDREFGGVNRGFHMGEDYMTIDISLEKRADIKELTPSMIDLAEYLANEVIWANVPVTVMHFNSKEEAQKCPVRKPVSIEKNITIVSVGSIKNPSDCVACCGTHPNTSGAVGLIKIYKVEPYKKMFRIYFDAGKNAFLSYVKKHELVSSICKEHSAKDEDLKEKLHINEEKHTIVKNKLYEAYSTIVSLIAENFKVSYLQSSKDKLFIGISPNYSLGKNEIGNLSKILQEFDNSLFIIKDEEKLISYLCSKSGADCKALGEIAANFDGKGGGSPSFASYKFESKEKMEDFLQTLKNKFS